MAIANDARNGINRVNLVDGKPNRWKVKIVGVKNLGLKGSG